jgi:hypothetical protein
VADHPVKVSAELVRRLREEAASSTAASQLGTGHARQDHFIEYIANRAAQWGADQELEACCEWVGYPVAARQLRAARRPKPPSLAERALEQYERVEDILLNHDVIPALIPAGYIRAALNRLAELEAQQ